LKVADFYHQECKARGYQPDPAQEQAIVRLQQCEDQWVAYKEIRSNALTKKNISSRAPPRGLSLGRSWQG